MMLTVFCLFALVAGPILANTADIAADVASSYDDNSYQLFQLQSKVAMLESQMRKNVAFSVRTDQAYQHYLDIGQNLPIRFTYVLTNIGNGYNTVNGYFTAPYSGVYQFFLNVRSYADLAWVHVGIYKNENLLALASTDGLGAIGAKGVAMAITHVNAGDAVYCKRQEGPGSRIEDSWFTTFSGFLITPD